MVAPLKTGPWNLSELKNIQKNNFNVFSCFHCGGGSTMGYKLAGYNVLGGVEIDPEMMSIYRANHNPKFSYLMGVQNFKNIPDSELPSELFNLDILDGSPPCSSFSMSGNREKNWGDKKKFREGQAEQVLDDLFFDFIATAKKLQPKIVVAENVKGLILGNAKGYVKEIFAAFKKAGYETQLFLLNAAAMGVPQKRERTFFVARRSDLKLPPIKFNFNESEISVEKALIGLNNQHLLAKKLSPETALLWKNVLPGQSLAKAHPKGHRFNAIKINPKTASGTIAASADGCPIHWNEPRRFSTAECARIQTFPDDYDFQKFKDNYICGMSVPPLMMQRVANQIEIQWLSKLIKK